MKEFFLNIINGQLAVTMALIVLFMLRPFMKKHFSATVRHRLWAVVLIRLCFPVDIDTKYIGIRDIPVAVPQINSVQTENRPVDDIIFTPHGTSGSPQQIYTTEPLAVLQDTTLSVIDIAMYIWFTVMIYRLVRNAGYISEKDRLLKKCRYDEVLDYLLSRKKYRMGIDKYVRIAWCDYDGSPMLVSWFEPIILIPENTSRQDMDIILTHELTHLKRNDVLFKFALNIRACVYWFNPLVGKMVKYACEDMEYACDEQVIKDRDNAYIADYAQSILNSAAYGKKMILATNLMSDADALKERFGNIFSFRKMGFRYKIAAGMLLAAVIGVMAIIGTDINTIKVHKNNLVELREVDVYNVVKSDDIQWTLKAYYAVPGSVLSIHGGGRASLITENPAEICSAEMLNSYSSPQEAGRLVITAKENLAYKNGDSVSFSTGMNWPGQLQAVGYEKGVKTICRIYGIYPDSEELILADVKRFMDTATSENNVYWHKNYGSVNVGVHYWNYGTGCVEITLMDNTAYNMWLEKLEYRQQAVEDSPFDNIILPADDFPSEFRDFWYIYNEDIYGGFLHSNGVKNNSGAQDCFGYVERDMDYSIRYHKGAVKDENNNWDEIFSVNTITGQRGNGVSYITADYRFAYNGENVYTILKDMCYMFNPAIDADVVYSQFVSDIESNNYNADYDSWIATINGVVYFIEVYNTENGIMTDNMYVMDSRLAKTVIIGPSDGYWDGNGEFHYN